MDYFFKGPIQDRQLSHNREFDYYEIAKFDPDRSDGPFEVYRIYLGTQSCNCPSPYKPCKHTQWLMYWLELDNHIRYYLDDTTNQWRLHPFLYLEGLNKWLNTPSS